MGGKSQGLRHEGWQGFQEDKILEGWDIPGKGNHMNFFELSIDRLFIFCC